jgi:para-nitrobenzyl esterase
MDGFHVDGVTKDSNVMPLQLRISSRGLRALCMVLVCIVGVSFAAGCSHTRTMPVTASDLAQGRIIHQVVASTTAGRVAGRVEADGLKSFLGIPYAKPMVGDLRFAKPQPPQPWQGVYPALAFGPVFPQIFDKTEPSSLYFQDEDCLRLNVWTPSVDTAKRPVMVFIHGGGYIWGSNADPLYDGGNLARRGNVVTVNPNYRMGALGYLDLSAVGGEEYLDSGNLGVLDQVAALKWVRDNIANFGGDPANVTVFGESAGAGSVATLLTVKEAQGLFSRAIPESGAFRITRSKEHALRVTRRFMELAGVSDLKGLKALSQAEILQAQEKLIKEAGLGCDRLFGPVRDGRIVPEDPLQAVREGCAKDVGLLTGTTEDETRFWIKYEPLLPYVPASILLSFTPDTKVWDTKMRDTVIAYYKDKMPGAKSGDVGLAIGTDFFFRMPQIHLAEAQAGFGKTWMYLFTWDSPVENGLYGSRHALELRFVMDTLDPDVGTNPPLNLVDAMQDSWIAFAKTGNPNHRGLPFWPEYNNDRRATMIFDEECKVVDDPGKEYRLFWEAILPGRQQSAE